MASADVVFRSPADEPDSYLSNGRQGSAKTARCAVPGRPLGRFVESPDRRAEAICRIAAYYSIELRPRAVMALSRTVSSGLRVDRAYQRPASLRPSEGHALPALQGLPSYSLVGDCSGPSQRGIYYLGKRFT